MERKGLGCQKRARDRDGGGLERDFGNQLGFGLPWLTSQVCTDTQRKGRAANAGDRNTIQGSSGPLWDS